MCFFFTHQVKMKKLMFLLYMQILISCSFKHLNPRQNQCAAIKMEIDNLIILFKEKTSESNHQDSIITLIAFEGNIKPFTTTLVNIYRKIYRTFILR